MKVKWIKAGDGLGGQPVIDAPSRARRSMEELAQDLQGTEDLLAFYVTRICGDKKYRSKICAFVQIPDGAVTQILQQPDYTWNDPLRWPVSLAACTPWKGIPDHMLDDLNTHCRHELGEDAWRILTQSELRGRAVRIDSGKYAGAGRNLTQFVRSNWQALIPLPDRGDDNVPRGSHRA